MIKLSKIFCFNKQLYFNKRFYSSTIDIQNNINSNYINNSKNKILLWLAVCSGSVLFMISLGGYTRLTKSGLSMTDWRPITKKYPRSLEEWNYEFDNYKKYPEFKISNSNMDLEGFKNIYFYEYFHRLWGNLIGGIIVLPYIYFNIKKSIKPKLNKRMLGIIGFLGFQGGVGWWMVKSGLEERKEYIAGPKVSHYRLIFHLTNAFIIYTLLLNSYFKIKYEHININSNDFKNIFKVKKMAFVLAHLFILNLVSGAAVAGIEAGRVFNTFPLMNGKFIPNGYFKNELGYKNLFENMGCVQFNHRIIAYIQYIMCSYMFYFTLKHKLPKYIKNPIMLSYLLINIQLLSGIYILLNQVPVNSGSYHQTNSILYLSMLLYIINIIKK